MNFVDSNQTEAELLSRILELDDKALAEVHDLFYPRIFRYAFVRTGDTDIAADIASETFLRLLDAINKGRPPHTTLRGWLFGVAAHLVVDFYNRKKYSELDETQPANSSTHVDAETNLRRAEVQIAIETLTSEQQEVLALRFTSGFSIEETAVHMHRSVTAVKAVQFRAIDALRQRLAEVEIE